MFLNPNQHQRDEKKQDTNVRIEFRRLETKDVICFPTACCNKEETRDENEPRPVEIIGALRLPSKNWSAPDHFCSELP